jgi:hypothetical protein
VGKTVALEFAPGDNSRKAVAEAGRAGSSAEAVETCERYVVVVEVVAVV